MIPAFAAAAKNIKNATVLTPDDGKGFLDNRSREMTLFYREVGSSGPAVLILHGLFGMSDNWLSFARRLENDYHLFLLDLRNHGRSPHSAEMNYGVMAGDVSAFIRETIGTACSVVGHSMGGKVAMQLALEQPQLINTLVSVDIAPKRYRTSQFHDFLTVMMGMDLTTLNSRGQADDILKEKLNLPLATRQFLLKNIYRNDQNRFQWRANLSALFTNLETLLDEPGTAGVFDKPALFARGSASPYIKDDDIPRIRALFPRAEIRDIPGANHWVHASAPAALEAALRDFWQKAKCGN